MLQRRTEALWKAAVGLAAVPTADDSITGSAAFSASNLEDAAVEAHGRAEGTSSAVRITAAVR